jgi:hypothetical protein
MKKGHIMYKVRYCPGGQKPTYVRFSTEQQAREQAKHENWRYVGPVVVTETAGPEAWREVKKR